MNWIAFLWVISLLGFLCMTVRLWARWISKEKLDADALVLWIYACLIALAAGLTF